LSVVEKRELVLLDSFYLLAFIIAYDMSFCKFLSFLVEKLLGNKAPYTLPELLTKLQESSKSMMLDTFSFLLFPLYT